MKIEMAENEYFSIGSIVACTTCHKQKIQGEVLAFDLSTKMLAIKCPAASGKHNVNDVRLVNLGYVSDVTVVKEADRDEPAPPLTNLNIQKITTRLRQNLEEKKRQVNSIGVGVSPHGQQVFNAIVKTLNDVKWKGQNISVMDEVTIEPPYGLEDCHGKDGSKALDHVKKIVQKYLKDQEQAKNSDLRKSLSPSPSSSTSS